MAPNGQTGKPACLLRLKIGFRNLGFFLKYVGGSHWEHNKKLVNILCLYKSSFLDSQAFKRKSEQKGHNAVMIKLAIPNHQRNLIEWHLLMDFSHISFNTPTLYLGSPHNTDGKKSKVWCQHCFARMIYISCVIGSHLISYIFRFYYSSTIIIS